MIQLDAAKSMHPTMTTRSMLRLGGSWVDPQDNRSAKMKGTQFAARFGDGIVSSRSPGRGYHSPSKIPKLTLLTSEEMKKFGKMRREPRESTSPMSSTTVGVTFPSFIRAKFKINKGMKYCIDEVQSIAYIFGESMNPSEILFKRGDMKPEREDFYCLQPGQEPSAYVMQLMAYKTSWTQSQLQQRTVWSLPLHFSVSIPTWWLAIVIKLLICPRSCFSTLLSIRLQEFVLDPDIDDSQVAAFFFRDWLPRPAALRYIYVQMADKVDVTGEDHFYLVVVDINGGKMWLIDCYPTDDSIIR
ncbi:hypothetical protein S83_034578 [Arachis hypogaea]